MNIYTKFQNLVLLAVRVIIAAIFLVAAYYKLPFWSGLTGYVTASFVYLMQFLSIVEPLGALAVLLGILTRWAAGGLAIIMVGAIFVSKYMMNMGFVTSSGAGWNFPLIVLGGCLVLVAFGAGSWAVQKNK